MHCCFEQATTPFWFEDSDLAAVKAHVVECKMNTFYCRRDRDIFLHPEIFEQEMARFIICYMNTVVWSLTRPQVGTFSLILEDETWLEAVREGLLISMPHQPHSALPSMTSMFTSYLAATLKVMSEAPWGGCILTVALMPVDQLKPDDIEYHPAAVAEAAPSGAGTGVAGGGGGRAWRGRRRRRGRRRQVRWWGKKKKKKKKKKRLGQ